MLNKIKLWLHKFLPKNTKFDENKIVYKTTEVYLAEIMKLKLEGEGVHVIVINKRDSSYNTFGQIELYVHQDDVIKAKHIIEKEYE